MANNSNYGGHSLNNKPIHHNHHHNNNTKSRDSHDDNDVIDTTTTTSTSSSTSVTDTNSQQQQQQHCNCPQCNNNNNNNNNNYNNNNNANHSPLPSPINQQQQQQQPQYDYNHNNEDSNYQGHGDDHDGPPPCSCCHLSPPAAAAPEPAKKRAPRASAVILPKKPLVGILRKPKDLHLETAQQDPRHHQRRRNSRHHHHHSPSPQSHNKHDYLPNDQNNNSPVDAVESMFMFVFNQEGHMVQGSQNVLHLYPLEQHRIELIFNEDTRRWIRDLGLFSKRRSESMAAAAAVEAGVQSSKPELPTTIRQLDNVRLKRPRSKQHKTGYRIKHHLIGRLTVAPLIKDNGEPLLHCHVVVKNAPFIPPAELFAMAEQKYREHRSLSAANSNSTTPNNSINHYLQGKTFINKEGVSYEIKRKNGGRDDDTHLEGLLLSSDSSSSTSSHKSHKEAISSSSSSSKKNNKPQSQKKPKSIKKPNYRHKGKANDDPRASQRSRSKSIKEKPRSRNEGGRAGRRPH